MGKRLETKGRILNLLNEKEMTMSGLSRELRLSRATISQHLDELQRDGAIEKVENEHYKKLKYYRAKELVGPMTARYAKYVVAGVAAFAVLSVLFFYYGTNPATKPLAVNSANGSTVSQLITSGPPRSACPMLFYQLNGTVEGQNGFSVSYFNSSIGTVADYVIGSNSTGVLRVTESISSMLNEPQNSGIFSRQHYARIMQLNSPFNTQIQGINAGVTPQNYTAANNETLNLTVAITTSNAATNMTYWLMIDGPCGGGVAPALLTIGNGPYEGPANLSVVRYP